jgi:hypothetical protein
MESSVEALSATYTVASGEKLSIEGKIVPVTPFQLRITTAIFILFI